jgi:hypothetical protein
MSNKAVFGLLHNQAQLDRTLVDLKAAGFRPADVSALFPENLGNKDLATSRDSKAPEGAAVGGTTGAALGGALGWLVGIGALAIPGLGPFIAAGPIMAALAGVGAGAVAGGVTGALIGLGIPEYVAKRYEGRIKAGGILLSVHTDHSEWEKRAKQILEDCGAEDISSTSESSADYATTEKPVSR